MILKLTIDLNDVMNYIMCMSIELTEIEKEWVKDTIFYIDRNKELYINEKNRYGCDHILTEYQEPLKEILFKKNKTVALLNVNHWGLSWIAKAFLLGHKFKIRTKI
jgi:hypothetical protein